MIIDNNGNMFEDRRKKDDRRKTEIDTKGGRRGEDRRKAQSQTRDRK